jgi:hypothetical protein
MVRAFVMNEPMGFNDRAPARGYDGKDWGGGIAKLLKNSFRIFGALTEAEMLPWGEDKKWADEQMDEHLSAVAKIISFFGFKYLTLTQEQADAFEVKGIEKKFYQLAAQISTNPDMSDKEKRESLDLLANYSKERIKKVLPKSSAMSKEEIQEALDRM